MTDSLASLKSALADRYTIERELGAGGMATVYLAHDIKHDRKVAVKVLRPELAAVLGPDRFLQETRIAARLHHPHILQLYDSGEANGFLYYVMPYIKGESLRERIANQGELPLTDAVRILKEIVDALAKAHSQNVIHRDIKPDNVMLADRHALVTDFGVAKAVSESTGAEQLTTAGVALGTPAYMAPEQATADPHVDHRADIYAVGVLAYEMLTGRPPFTGATQQEVLAAHLTQAPKPVTDFRDTVPPTLAELVARCLEKKPADRWQTAEEMLTVLEALGTPSWGVTPTATVPAALPTNLTRTALVWIGAVAVVAVFGALFLPGLTSPSEESAPRLMVAPFENRAGNSEVDWLSDYAADWITREIDRAGFIEVVSNRSRRDALVELETQERSSVGLAERFGATVMVAGSFLVSNGRLVFDAEILDPTSDTTYRNLESVSGAVDSAEAIVGELAERVIGAALMLFDPDRPGWFDRGMVPPSRESYRQWRTGQNLWCELRYDSALVHFEAALEFDSLFVPPLLDSYWAYRNRGRFPQADSVLEILEGIRDRLSREEELHLAFAKARISDEPQAVYETAKAQNSIDPRIWGSDAAIGALWVNRPSEALEFLAQYDFDQPCAREWVPIWSYRNDAHHMVGDFEGELQSAREARTRFPQRFGVLDDEIRALAAMGRVAEVDSLIELAFTLDGATRTHTTGYRWAYAALEYRAHGFRDAYEDAINRAATWFENRSREVPSSAMVRGRARTLYWAERFEEAYQIFDSLTAEYPDSIELQGYRGATLAYLGRVEEALEVDEWLQGLDQTYMRGYNLNWSSSIAAILGERDRAMRLIHQSYRQGFGFRVWFHREPEWENLRDYPPFQEFMRPKG